MSYMNCAFTVFFGLYVFSDHPLRTHRDSVLCAFTKHPVNVASARFANSLRLLMFQEDEDGSFAY